MDLHTKFHKYSTKIEVPTSQNVVWPTIMAQTLINVKCNDEMNKEGGVQSCGQDPL